MAHGSWRTPAKITNAFMKGSVHVTTTANVINGALSFLLKVMPQFPATLFAKIVCGIAPRSPTVPIQCLFAK